MSPKRAQQIAESVLRAPPGTAGENELAHVTRVASSVTAEARSVAWLHDVVERSSITVEDLIVAGLSGREAEAVRILTRDTAEESERSYLRPDGWTPPYADAMDMLESGRPLGTTDGQRP